MKKTNIIWDIDKRQLERLVFKSLSFSDVLRLLNLSTNGGTNHRCLKKRLVEEDISFKHFEPWKSAKITFTKTRVPTKNLLIENAKNYASSGLKKRLIEDGLLKNKCNKCGLSPEWNGLALSLQLEHKNGDHFDNRMENLEILCPNCHTQTLTYGSKRRKISYVCLGCGRKTSKHATMCMQCLGKSNSIKNRKIKNRPSLEVLLKEVKDVGYCAVGRRYNVSDNAVRKWIKNYIKTA